MLNLIKLNFNKFEEIYLYIISLLDTALSAQLKDYI